MDQDALVALFRTKIEQLKTGQVTELHEQILTQVATLLTTHTTPVFVLEVTTELIATSFTHSKTQSKIIIKTNQFNADVVKKAMANTPRPVIDSLFVCLENNTNMLTVQQNILSAIGNLTGDQDASQDWLVNEYDAITLVINVLKQASILADVQAKAFYALQKIAIGHKANIGVLFSSHRAHELAITSIETHSAHAPLITQACALLRRLSWMTETNAILMPYACSSVLQCMRSFMSEPEIQEHGCVLIHNLARDYENMRPLTHEPYLAHEVILIAMRKHPQVAPLQKNGCAALWHLACDAQNCKVLVCEPYLAHEVILSAMRHHPRDTGVQEMGCSALWSIVVDDDNKKLLVGEPHFAHKAILSAMRNHPHSAFTQEKGCGALANFAVYNENQKLLVQLDAHITIIAALQIHPQIEDLQIQAVWALTNLSFEVSNRLVLKNFEALPLCEKALRSFPNSTNLIAKLSTLQTKLA